MALARANTGWTYDDLLALDDGKRYEIIEGELFEMTAPNALHAVSLANLFALLGPIVRALRGMILVAPVDVFMAGADPVEPDIVVLLPGSAARLVRRGVEGPPDLLVEVLSPSTRGRDLLTKRALYARAGVREYWILDGEAETVEVLGLDRDAFHTLQIAAGHDRIVSQVLPAVAFTAADVFAGVAAIPEGDDEG
jgi:Uma2 family endonuclease